VQLEEEVAKPRGCGVERCLELIDGGELRGVGELPSEDPEPQSECGHLLERIVVDVLRDPFAFLLLYRDDTFEKQPALLIVRPELRETLL